MTHHFLLKPGKWSIVGQYQHKNREVMNVRGSIVISWKRENWFKMATHLSIPNLEEEEVISQCRGHLNDRRNSYTYVLQHSILGNIEGEGWLNSNSIVQNYWIVGTNQRHFGFDSFYRLSEETYLFTSILSESHNLASTMEATLKQTV